MSFASRLSEIVSTFVFDLLSTVFGFVTIVLEGVVAALNAPF